MPLALPSEGEPPTTPAFAEQPSNAGCLLSLTSPLAHHHQNWLSPFARSPRPVLIFYQYRALFGPGILEPD
jgi:hypothetical protein